MELTSAGLASACFSAAAFAREPIVAMSAAAAERSTPLLGMEMASDIVMAL
jgi:hypothetical protein